MNAKKLNRRRWRLVSRFSWRRRRAARWLARDGGSEAVGILASVASHGKTESVRNLAFASLCELGCAGNQLAREVICHMAVERDGSPAQPVVLETGYAPKDPYRRALFYFMTEQWDKYEDLDFDHRLLQVMYASADKSLRQRVASRARDAGRTEWVQVAAGGGAGRRLAEMTHDEWETAITVLDGDDGWDSMWRLAQQAPVVWSARMLNMLNQAGWTPESDDEQKGFRELSELAELCRDNHPAPPGLMLCRQMFKGLWQSPFKLDLAIPFDGRMLVSSLGDTTVHNAWSLPEGHAIESLQGHMNKPCMAMSPDGRLLASASGTRSTRINIWRLPEGQPVGIIMTRRVQIAALEFSPDGGMLAGSARADPCIRLWNMREGDMFGQLEGHSSPVTSMVYTPDGRMLASAGERKGTGTIRLWSLPDGELITTVKGHKSGVDSLTRVWNERFLASTGRDGAVTLWSMPEGKQQITLKNKGQYAIGQDGTVLVWRTGIMRKGCMVWRIPKGELFDTLSADKPDSGRVMAISDDGRLMAVTEQDQSVKVWRMPEGEQLSELEAHETPVTAVALDVQNGILATGTRHGWVHLWRMSDGQPLALLTGHDGPIHSLTFGHSGRLLASASHRSILLWNLALDRLPVDQSTLEHLAWMQVALREQSVLDSHRPWLDLLTELMRWRRRVDVIVENVPIQRITVGKFDIEIEG